MEQPALFQAENGKTEIEKITLYALGEFQARGKVLAERELALDRLRGAFKRAAEKFGVAEIEDERIAETLETLGARVKRVPSFVAKHPFRVTVTNEIAARAKGIYNAEIEKEKDL